MPVTFDREISRSAATAPCCAGASITTTVATSALAAAAESLRSGAGFCATKSLATVSSALISDASVTAASVPSPKDTIDSGEVNACTKSGATSPLKVATLSNTNTALLDFSATIAAPSCRMRSTGLPSMVAGPAIGVMATSPSIAPSSVNTNKAPSVATAALPTSDKSTASPSSPTPCRFIEFCSPSSSTGVIVLVTASTLARAERRFKALTSSMMARFPSVNARYIRSSTAE